MIPGSKGLRFVLHKKESRLRDSLRRARVAYATIYFSRECASLAERFLCNRQFEGITYYIKKESHIRDSL